MSVELDPAWPVLVKAGEARTAALMNRKAYRKSVESGTPWVVHPATGRVLPWPGSPEIWDLIEGPGHFALELPENATMHPYGVGVPPDVDPDDRSKMTSSPVEKCGSTDNDDILVRLWALIAERRETMPSGSYTTHLFEAGPEKMRKKVGEEVIELVLAGQGADVVYEAADLIYHVQVLLTALDLEWSDVTRELARRHPE